MKKLSALVFLGVLAQGGVGDHLVTASDGATEDYFGASMAASEDGSLLAVGAPGDADDQGAVYVYSCVGKACTEITKLTANDGVAGDYFGGSVGVSGGLVAVGAESVSSDAGAVYLYQCTSSACSFIEKIVNPSSTPSTYFGGSVAASGTLLVASAEGTNSMAGEAYVFDCSSSPCSQVSQLTPPSSASFQSFGSSVAASGSKVVVGAFGASSAYLYDCSSGCSQVATLTGSSSSSVSDQFGVSSAISGNLVAIGAPGSVGGKGLTYVFDCSSGSSCVEVQKLSASWTAGFDDMFGYSVSLSGGELTVGAPGYNSNRGRLSLLTCTVSGCGSATTTSLGFSAGSELGWSVSSSSGSVASAALGYSSYQGAVQVFGRDLTCSGETYGTATYSVTPAGTYAVGTCTTGYEGSPLRLCQESLVWSEQVINHCARKTCSAETSGNANWFQTNSGDTVIGTCVSGFTGIPHRKCGEDGTWEAVQSPCVANQACPSQTFANALWPTTNSGAQVLGACVSGYSGSPFRTCEAGGVWDSLVINHCTRNVCPAENFGGASWPSTKSLMTATGTCAAGTTGTVTRFCQSSGAWSTVSGSCITPGSCPAVTEYARASYPVTAPNTYAVGTCKSGWTGAPKRKCEANGTWNQNVIDHCVRV